MASIIEKLRQKFRKVRTAKGGDGHVEYQICCPYCISRGHSADRKFHMYINSVSGLLKCWRCEYHGHLDQLIGKVDGLLANQPAEPAVVAVTSPEVLARIPPPFDIDKGGGLIPIDRLDPDHPAILYLTKTRKRPFDPVELARTFSVSYCNIGKVFRPGGVKFDATNTLVFQIFWHDPDAPGKQVLIGWQARLLYDPDSLSDSECADREFERDAEGNWLRPPKYFTNPGLKKGRILYNYVNARAYRYVVVTEGVFDTFSVGPQAVALFGKAPTAVQLSLLKTYWDDVILLLDPGDAEAEMSRALDELSRAVRVTMVNLKGTKDAGDLSRNEVWRQISAQIELDHKRLAVAAQGVVVPSYN